MRCKNATLQGSTVCGIHGKAEQVKAKAQERMMDAMEPLRDLLPDAVAAVQQILRDMEAKPADRLKAAESVLDRFVAKKVHAEVEDNREVRDLDQEIAGLYGETDAETG